MSAMPNFLYRWIGGLYKYQAKVLFWWLNSNSNTVIVDELLQAVRKRRDWSSKDES